MKACYIRELSFDEKGDKMGRIRFLLSGMLFCAMVLGALMASGCGCGTKAPSVTSISPSSGEAGTEVVIRGTDFGESQGNGKVEFGDMTADVSEWSNTEIKAKVPSEVETGDYEVKVVAEGGTSEGVDFEVKAAEKKKEEKKTEKHQTKLQLIEDYCDANNISRKGVAGQTLSISFYASSRSDPSWELWDMPYGEGDDIRFFLLHEEDGQWNVVATGMNDFNPQASGAPADLEIKPEDVNPEGTPDTSPQSSPQSNP
jgi:hypothetical protein